MSGYCFQQRGDTLQRLHTEAPGVKSLKVFVYIHVTRAHGTCTHVRNECVKGIWRNNASMSVGAGQSINQPSIRRWHDDVRSEMT